MRRGGVAGHLVRSFLVIIFITVFIIDVATISAYRYVSYKGIEAQLAFRQENNALSFQQYEHGEALEDIVYRGNIFEVNNVRAQVQVIDSKGRVLIDSLGAIGEDTSTYSDVQAALQGEQAVRRGSVKFSDEEVLSISSPLWDHDGQRVLGVLRYSASLTETNQDILRLSLFVLGFGLFVITLTTLVSLILARSIVRPVRELTEVAEKMRDGHYQERTNLRSGDELQKLGETLNTLAEEILKKDQIKNDFISSISHELRTPLTSIKGWASILKSTDPSEKSLFQDGLGIIEHESDRLTKMVEELLDFSRYISGRITLKKETFNIVETCREIAKQMGPRADSLELEFSWELPEGPILLFADEDRLRQLLINLLDNAMKFTDPRGKVFLGLYDEEDVVRLLVEDTGVGISPEDLLHVKEKFYKGKHSKSHSGIGLSISDEIVNLHHGSMHIFSKEEEGTKIQISLPKEVEG